jgi:hypothetical protein
MTGVTAFIYLEDISSRYRCQANGVLVMMRAVTAADGRTVTTGDGRTLRFAEWGQPQGFPVFSLHGAPGSRFARFFDENAYVEVGARVITYRTAWPSLPVSRIE